MRRELARTKSAGQAARSAVADVAGELGVGTAETAKLLVTELATNAVRHGQGRITLEIRIQDGEAHFSVMDEGHGLIRQVDIPGQNGGYGLALVDELAADWGVGTGRSYVWFTLMLVGP